MNDEPCPTLDEIAEAAEAMQELLSAALAAGAPWAQDLLDMGCALEARISSQRIAAFHAALPRRP